MFDLTEDDRPPLAWLIAVQRPGVTDEEQDESLDELRRLAKTLGHDVQGRMVQKRARPDRARILGPGKVKELKELIDLSRPVSDAANPAADADHSDDSADESKPEGDGRERWVLVDEELSPSQVRELSRAVDALVMDRKGVILEIFHRHAKSRAAKAQVELVRLAYLAPRLRELRSRGGQRQRGGIGGKGAGESSSELDRRKVRDRLAELRAEIAKIEVERTTQRQRRQHVQRVALVGYTNAGKSTLMSALTGGDVYIADKLFATLDTTVRILTPAVEPPIVISDTVGFIRKLPHDLVSSFRSTLDEALEANLLLHVVDGSDPSHPHHIATTRAVLEEIGAADIREQLVFNKCDQMDADTRAALERAHPSAFFISAKDPEDAERIHGELVAFFGGGFEEATIRIPHSEGATRAALLSQAELLDEAYDEDGGQYRVRAASKWLDHIRALLGA